ncbi:dihydropteroate synthase [Paenibacillus nasutitermitis]|uniref:Dihydropteroate synthase n=1 Tax=Paenibacillus nasutitermitis TaxID=1652958 RepID=A0A916ZIN8_9BACL|nr:dihydropteroate synthase [Paenibacillus nasutitermitis]GGD99788.1 dihydropteroate synthase [Paenibacillus nasutitermitis]
MQQKKGETAAGWPYSRSYKLDGGIELELGRRTLIMGILNITPNSFSDGGRFNTLDAAVRHASAMAAEGADIIDIGGESTRPGYEPVPLEEELDRVLPVIRAVRQALPHIPISIDTYKAETARQSLLAGANIINDIWGLKGDPGMAGVAAEFRCPVIIGHNRRDMEYNNFVQDVIEDLLACVDAAQAAGISETDLWLDPGIGFAKNYEENLTMMGNLEKLTALGYPVLLGTSRKRFIARTLDLPADQIIMGTAATTTIGISKGCQIVRVHDVQEMKRNALMADAIVYRTLH